MKDNPIDKEHRIKQVIKRAGIHKGVSDTGSQNSIENVTDQKVRKAGFSRGLAIQTGLFLIGIIVFAYWKIKKSGVLNDLPEYLPEALIFLVAIALPSFLWWKIQASRRTGRTNELRRYASMAGYNFSESDLTSEFRVPSTYHFVAVKSKTITNVLSRKIDSRNIQIFDYKYCHPERVFWSRIRAIFSFRTNIISKDSPYYVQTVFCFHASGVRFPFFHMRPETILEKIDIMAGGQDIDFTDQPEFSRKFRLCGTNESEIRTFFTPERRHRLEAMDKDLWIEGADEKLVVFRRGKKLQPEHLDSALQETMAVATVFL